MSPTQRTAAQRFNRSIRTLENLLAKSDVAPSLWQGLIQHLNDDHRTILEASHRLVQHIAGDQESESVIDTSFNHPGLGARVNVLRRVTTE